VVDASQGVEAQTLANVYQAIDNNHELVTVLNKIDLPAAEPDRIKRADRGGDRHRRLRRGADFRQDRPRHSGRAGSDRHAAAAEERGSRPAPLKALLVDSWYDTYLGVMVLVRVIDGVLKKGQTIRMMGTGARYGVERVGVLTPKMRQMSTPSAPARSASSPPRSRKWPIPASATRSPTTSARPLQRCRASSPAQPVVFCGLFPVDAADFEDLRAAMGKLRLNDASFSFEMESSAALGFGFRCGFLGLLHLEIIQERLEREFNLDLDRDRPIGRLPDDLTDGTEKELHNPADMPDVVKIDEIREPWIKATILTPDEYLGGILKLCQDRRGIQTELYLCRQPRDADLRPAAQRSGLRFLRPAEVDLQGLCLLRLHIIRLPRGRPGEDVDPRQRRAGRRASMLVHRNPAAEKRGRGMCEKLKELIPPHMFKIPIQAAIGGKVIARETVSGAPQGRDRQVLRRRRHPQAQAARQAEGRQEAHAPVRQGRNPAGSVHRGAEDGG
jgi:GTP-binding protein LepA